MQSIVNIYTDTVYENLRPLYANWEPGKPVQLGDFGILRDHTFINLGNIDNFNLTFHERTDSTKDQKIFTSKDSVEVKFHARGSVPVSGIVNTKASLEVSFSNQDAVFFNAAECEYSMISDKVALGKNIMSLYEKGDWQREWVIVTDLIRAGATTLAISGGRSATIVFEATGDVERINLAEAALGLSVKSASNVGYQVVAENGLIPLLGLCKIQSSFLWWDEKFKPLTLAFNDKRVLDSLENSPRFKTEESNEALHFGQLK